MYSYNLSLADQEPLLVPYFQPILSLQNQKVIGYEALGRHLTGNGAVSLGPFFHDRSIAEKEQLRVDRIIREKAIRRMAESGSDGRLFLNLRPSWIYRKYKKADYFPTFRYLERHGFPPDRLVIEITEEASNASPQELIDIVKVYRDKGCHIAIDDVGSGFSNFDRIALLRPEIIKVDLKLMKKSAVHDGYNALLRSYSILAEQMGASLLMEGIETVQDLQHALNTGARFVQGYLFSPASGRLVEPDAYSELLRGQLADFAGEQLAKYQELLAVNLLFGDIVREPLESDRPEDADRFIQKLLPGVPRRCLRIYLCSEDGTQVSSNFTRDENCKWMKDPSFRKANWIWRPYFIPNIVRMQHNAAPSLSQIYTDLETSKIMHTFSGKVGDGLYLFFDLTV